VIANTSAGQKTLSELKEQLNLVEESYDLVDGIQDKADIIPPIKYDYYLKSLREGHSPISLITKEMSFAYLKGSIKSILNTFILIKHKM
jgi:hypothetical protein